MKGGVAERRIAVGVTCYAQAAAECDGRVREGGSVTRLCVHDKTLCAQARAERDRRVRRVGGDSPAASGAGPGRRPPPVRSVQEEAGRALSPSRCILMHLLARQQTWCAHLRCNLTWRTHLRCNLIWRTHLRCNSLTGTATSSLAPRTREDVDASVWTRARRRDTT